MAKEININSLDPRKPEDWELLKALERMNSKRAKEALDRIPLEFPGEPGGLMAGDPDALPSDDEDKVEEEALVFKIDKSESE